MSDFFSSVTDDLDKLEEDILGPDYPYYKYVKSPQKMGMGPGGDKIGTNLGGLIAYTKVLASGGGAASATGKPLGNRFFLETGAKCKDTDSGEKVTRSLYINNVPDGTIPFISDITGSKFTALEGLIPGVLSNMEALNPLAIFQAFMMGNTPDCQSVTMETIDTDNVTGEQTAYVATDDLRNMNPCWFPDGKNVVTGEKCGGSEGFSNIKVDRSQYPDDTLIKIYYSALGIFGLYLLMKLFTKRE